MRNGYLSEIGNFRAAVGLCRFSRPVGIFPEIRPVGLFLKPPLSPTKIPTHTEDSGRGEIRPAGAIFKFPAASGGRDSNVNLQAGSAHARIYFEVEMVTPVPCRPPSAAEITDYILAKRVRAM